MMRVGLDVPMMISTLGREGKRAERGRVRVRTDRVDRSPTETDCR